MSRSRDRVRNGSRHRRRRVLTIVGVIAAVVAIVLFVGVAAAAAVVSGWLKNLPDYESPTAFQVARPTRIYSADGKLLARLYLEDREVVPYSKIATDLVDALVAVEDERFYLHHGVDWQGVVRAVVANITAPGSRPQGASTITQEYIRNTILLNEKTTITLERKVREQYLALELEKRRSKQEILTLYLNTVYFGEGSYGAEAASREFFAKHADQLTLPEAALLAGLVQQPSRLDPYDNPEGALERRHHVLNRMLANGYITKAEYAKADAAKLTLKRSAEPESGIYQAAYFVAHVKKELQQRYPQSVVFKGGLTVYTTLDTRLQKYAEDSVKKNLGQRGDPDTALVSIDPRNGYIKAMYGGSDYSTNKFNLATQGRRQPGSSFKTFVLVTALQEGMPPTRYLDSSSPAYIPTKPKPWVVSNSEGTGHGMVTMQTATRLSINAAFARLIWELGADKVVKVAHKMGITSTLPAYPSIALGSANCTPLEMASAYGTLANGGLHYAPIAITKIVDSEGKTILKARSKATRAVSAEVAGAAVEILKGVITSGTGTRANIGRPAAGKTGTSQDYRDAWFVGFTPQLVTSVWVGYYKAETPMRSVHGRRGFGGTLAAPIWAAYMKPALADQPKLDFKKYDQPEYTYKPEWTGAKVPNLIGMTKAKAQAALSDKGLSYTITEVYDEAAKGTVVSQSPAANTRVAPGSSVSFSVSKGPKPGIPKPKPPTPPEPPPTSTTPPPANNNGNGRGKT
jgi:1A family penicillin-binding protein